MNPRVRVAVVVDDLPVRTALGRFCGLRITKSPFSPLVRRLSNRSRLKHLTMLFWTSICLECVALMCSGGCAPCPSSSLRSALPAAVLAREALDAGAVELLRKSFSDNDPLHAIRTPIGRAD
jgi:hypothetical protein